MKKNYVFVKSRTRFLVLLALFCGLFANTVKAQWTQNFEGAAPTFITRGAPSFVAEVAVNPVKTGINTTDKAMKITLPATVAYFKWAGLSNPGGTYNTANGKFIKFKFLSVNETTVNIQLEPWFDGVVNTTIPVQTFTGLALNTWYEVVFDYSAALAANPTGYCTRLDIKLNVPASGNYDGDIYYIDEMVQGAVPQTWTGTTSTDWNTASNWSSGVPVQNSFVTIATAANQPTIAANLTVNSLTVNSGATVSVNEGVVLNLTTGTLNNGDILLKSSASGTASLLCPTSAANVTQQRYLSSNQRGWRLFSNPLATTTFNTIATASTITVGTNYTGAYDSALNTWSSTDGTANMEYNKAYKLFITGLSGESPTYASGPSNVTLVNKGAASNTSPAAIATTAGQFYLVANPYTAPVSVSSIIAASTGLSTSVSYYNPTKAATDPKVKAGGYDAIAVSGAAGSATDVVLPPMGAIFVQATSAGTINLPKTVIYTGVVTSPAGNFTHKTAQTKVDAPIAINLDVTTNGVTYDNVQLRFKEVGTAGSNVDFGKLPNTFVDFYSINGGNNMAVSELELKVQTIPLGITSTIQKSYTLKVAENTIPAGYEAELVDTVLNTTTPLTAGASYNFAIDSTPASQGNARFAINLKTAGTLTVQANELDATIELYPNPAHGQFNILNTQSQNEAETKIEIYSVNGQLIHSQKSNPGTTTTIQTNGWAAGVYMLKATHNGAQTTKKLIIQ